MIANLIIGAVVVTFTSFLQFIASSNIGISNSSGWAVAVVSSNGIVAEGVSGAWIGKLNAFVDVDAGEIRQVSKASGADAESILGSDVDTVLVLMARIGRGAVSRLRDTEVSTSLKVGWTSAVFFVETNKVSGTVVVDSAYFDLDTADVWVSSVTWWAGTRVAMSLYPADGVNSTRIPETWIDTIRD